ncbi:MAG: hypothetical protein DWQ37_00155 [Planctomycetota bacterium]|nr:MAG: hypothetical protein DWQ37_00155 [Planctomycetota bacterium]
MSSPCQNAPASNSLPADAVFPLPLTPFELYYYLDDRPACPTTFPVELLFTGTLDRERFYAALEETVRRHPLLRAAIDDRSGTPRWVPAAGEQPFIDWDDSTAPITHPDGEFIDLKSAPGLRTWVRTSPGQARVLFQFHHACCDGLAALEMVKDLLAAYKGDQPIKRDAELLRRRGDIVPPDTPKPSLAVSVRDALYTLNVWSWILLQQPVPLAAPAGASKPSPDPILPFVVATLSAAESRGLRDLAASHGVSSNDLLLRDWLVALRRWNETHAGSARGRLKVNVPVSLRTRDEARMPAANRLGYAFVTDDGTATDDAALLEVVRSETHRIKDWKLALYFLGGLTLASGFRSAIRWVLSRNASLATAVLSNVGRFAPERSLKRGQKWTCGDLVLDRVCGAPPIRKLTRAAMIVIEYGGATTFCLRCDPQHFAASDTQALLDAFLGQVRRTIASSDKAEPK